MFLRISEQKKIKDFFTEKKRIHKPKEKGGKII